MTEKDGKTVPRFREDVDHLALFAQSDLVIRFSPMIIVILLSNSISSIQEKKIL